MRYREFMKAAQPMSARNKSNQVAFWTILDGITEAGYGEEA